jgi:hypothetical protein
MNEPRLVSHVIDLVNAFKYAKMNDVTRIQNYLIRYLGDKYESYITLFGQFDPAQNVSDSPADYEMIRQRWMNYQRALMNGQPSKAF